MARSRAGEPAAVIIPVRFTEAEAADLDAVLDGAARSDLIRDATMAVVRARLAARNLRPRAPVVDPLAEDTRIDAALAIVPRMSDAAIARDLGISVDTVRRHRERRNREGAGIDPAGVRPRFRGLSITADLIGRPDARAALHLDALLVQAMARRLRLPPLGRDVPLAQVRELDIPVERITALGVTVALASAWRIEGNQARWTAWGNPREVRKLLNLLDRAGDVDVLRWQVEEAPRLTPIGVLVDAEGRATRHLPAEWCAEGPVVRGAVADPYWHPERQRRVVAPGTTVDLRPEVAEALES